MHALRPDLKAPPRFGSVQMKANHYEFTTHWRVRASLAEVNEVLGDALSLPRWWPAVYLAAEAIASGAPNSHEGGIIELRTRGWLPYTLCWRLHLTHNNAPRGFSFDVEGDFVGSGVWTLSDDGRFVNVRFDWRVTAEKPLLFWFSWLLRPIFVLNHRWAMARGEESLKRELSRRRASRARASFACEAVTTDGSVTTSGRCLLLGHAHKDRTPSVAGPAKSSSPRARQNA